jgi:uncharacterized protein
MRGQLDFSNVKATSKAEMEPVMASKQRRLIEVAKDLSLDESAATETLGVLARKGRGKTFLASKIVEGLHRLNCPTTIIDPAGNWWGLTLAANGRDVGLPFVVLGGERGDLELAAESGQRLAEIVVQRRLNVVLDVSGFDDKDLSRFVGDFLETFRLCSQRQRQARMVVFEEAQLLAPQQFSGQMQRMLKGVERIVRLGRNYGIGSMLISQRPQSVNKEVLSQVECLFVGQINEAHARKAVRDWIAEKDVDVKNQLDQLSKLDRGEFFCWSPSWLQIFQKVRVLPKWTFDASRTPVLGDAASDVEPRRERLTGDELAALREALGGAPAPATPSGVTEDVVKERELRRQAEDGCRKASEEAARLREQASELRRALTELHERLGGVLQGLHPAGIAGRPEPPKASPVRAEGALVMRVGPGEGARRVNGSAEERKDGGAQAGLDKCQRAILTVLAQQRKSLPKARLALMAGYSPNSGGFNNALSKLRTAGRIAGRGETAITAVGLKAAGSVPPLPQGAELFEYWLRHPRLDKCCRAIVTALRAQNGAVGKEELGTLTGYSATSGGFNNALSKLRTLGLIQGRGAVELVQDLY